MRYLLDNHMRNELFDRQRFLYDVFHIYTSVTYHKDYLELVSIPKEEINICFIVGHNIFTKQVLQQEKFGEKNIVTITCQAKVKISDLHLTGHDLFIAKLNEAGYVRLCRGKDFGFDFDLTESEIMLYRLSSSCSIREQLEECFIQVKDNMEVLDGKYC